MDRESETPESQALESEALESGAPESEALHEAIVAALRPTGLRARVGRRLGRGGVTVRQVYDALPAEVRPTGSAPGVAGEQQAMDALRAALFQLVAAGRVAHGRASGQYFLGTKGNRLVQVDLFRLA